jgi:hypothetical protein
MTQPSKPEQRLLRTRVAQAGENLFRIIVSRPGQGQTIEVVRGTRRDAESRRADIRAVERARREEEERSIRSEQEVEAGQAGEAGGTDMAAIEARTGVEAGAGGAG